MKNRFLPALAFAATLALPALAQDDPGQQPASRRAATDIAPSPEVLALAEENLGFTIWKPEHSSARQILHYVQDLTDRHVEFYVRDPLTGRFEAKRQKRDRFIQIEDAIGIQDFALGRKQALSLLDSLDASIGALSTTPTAPREVSLTRTVRPRSMGVDAAVALLSEMGFEIRMHIVRPTGTLVLNGPTADVARAESLLIEVDQPVPQMTLRCMLVEARTEPVDGVASEALDRDLVRGLAAYMPGRHFTEVGRLMLRAAAGGGAEFEVSSGVSGMASPGADRPARFQLSAVSQGWDAERGVLNLGSCNFLLERPTFQTAQFATGSQQQFSGYQQEGLSTNLALRAGETTVVGSLGGDPVFIVLSFEID